MYAIVRAALPEKNILLFCLLFFRSTYGCSLALVSHFHCLFRKKVYRSSYTVCRYAYKYVCTYLYAHIVYVYIYIYIYVCVYIYTNTAYYLIFPLASHLVHNFFLVNSTKKFFFESMSVPPRVRLRVCDDQFPRYQDCKIEKERESKSLRHLYKHK